MVRHIKLLSSNNFEMMKNIFWNIKYSRAKDSYGNIDLKRVKKMNNWFKKGNFLNYILREEAVFNLDIDSKSFQDLRFLKDEADKLWTTEKERINNLDELKTRKRIIYESYQEKIDRLKTDSGLMFSGLYSLDGPVSKNNLDEHYQYFNEINLEQQNIWSAVLSFERNFLKTSRINNINDLSKVVAKSLQSFLVCNNFSKYDFDKLEIGWAFHVNTDNLHAHVYWFEKQPTKYLKTNKKQYEKSFRIEGRMSPQSNRLFKLQIEQEMTQVVNKSFYQSKANLGVKIQDFKDVLKNFRNFDWEIDKYGLKELWQRLYELKQRFRISQTSNSQTYSSKTTPEWQRREINFLARDFLNNSPFLNKPWKDFEELNKNKSEKKFEIYLENLKLEYQYNSKINDVIKNLQSNDECLKLKEEDYKNYAKERQNIYFEKQNIESGFKDQTLTPIQYLKAMKINFESEYLYSFNDYQRPQGIMCQIGNVLFDFMKNNQIRKPPKPITKQKVSNFNKAISNSNYVFEKKVIEGKTIKKLKWLFYEIDQKLWEEKQKAKEKFYQIKKEISYSNWELNRSYDNGGLI